MKHTAAGMDYAIPPDNPFVGNTEGYREEIWAYGMRNPWRFGFDPVTGRLWCGDVGQNKYEEVDIIEKGHNYGWNTMEGFHCYNPASGCDTAGITLPVVEYDHSAGQSITGGRVYRGSVVPELYGKYVYADFGSGRIWTLEYEPGSAPANTLLVNSGLNISTFGTDEGGELYFAAFDGSIYTFHSEHTAVPALPAAAEGARIRSVYPNPAPFSCGAVSVQIALPARVPVVLTLYDALGRRVRRLDAGTLGAGERFLSLATAGLAAGAYRLMLLSGKNSRSAEILQIR